MKKLLIITTSIAILMIGAASSWFMVIEMPRQNRERVEASIRAEEEDKKMEKQKLTNECLKNEAQVNSEDGGAQKGHFYVPHVDTDLNCDY